MTEEKVRMTIRLSPEADNLLEGLEKALGQSTKNAVFEQIIREAAKKYKVKIKPETEAK